MSFEVALRSRIAGSPAVKATRASVEWNTRPQGSYPAVVLTIVSDRRLRTMTGFQGSRPVRVQIDVIALDRLTRIALREAVIAAVGDSASVGKVHFSGVRDLTTTEADEDDGPQRIYRDVIDGTFWHILED